MTVTAFTLFAAAVFMLFGLGSAMAYEEQKKGLYSTVSLFFSLAALAFAFFAGFHAAGA